MAGAAPGGLPVIEADPLKAKTVVRSFAAEGVVRELPADGASVVVRHEAIAGFMPRMTMNFTVRDTNELRGLQPGAAIRFTVRATEEDSWIEGIRVVDARAIADDAARPAGGQPNANAVLKSARLQAGQVLPDAELLGEHGRPVRLSDFSGRAVALTFIFTRCPMPDYCPRMNLAFRQAQELLAARTDGATNCQFLCISFDPEFDRPEVLRRYASRYRREPNERWLFASATPAVMAAFAAQLDFRFANEGGSFLHNLRTVVLDPARRLHRQFDGNKWTAAELAAALVEASQQTDR